MGDATAAAKPGPSRRAIIGWTAGMFAALAVAYLIGAVVVPVWNTRAAVARCGKGSKQAAARVEELGGKRAAAERLTVYLRLPAQIAPHRLRAVRMLAECEGHARAALPELLELLEHSDPEARVRTIRILGEVGDSAAVEPVIGALEDDSRDARAEAAKALGKLKDRRAVERLLAVLGSGGGEDLPAAAADALGEIGDGRAGGPLMDLLESEVELWEEEDPAKLRKRHWNTDREKAAVAAAKALGKLKEARAVEALVENVLLRQAVVLD